MRNLIVVAFLEPVFEGLEFPRNGWPLHITLVKFDVDDAVAGRVAALMDHPVRAALGSAVTVGGGAAFGRGGSIPVSLIRPSAALQDLHESLVTAAGSLSGRISTPGYTMAGYRPHVSHRGPGPREGEVLVLDRIALVDMAPDGQHATRRVLQLWHHGCPEPAAP